MDNSSAEAAQQPNVGPDDASTPLERGDAAYERGDLVEAERARRHSAGPGDRVAMYRMGPCWRSEATP